MAAKQNHQAPAPAQMKQQRSHPHGSAAPGRAQLQTGRAPVVPHPAPSHGSATGPQHGQEPGHSPGKAGPRQEWEGGGQHWCVAQLALTKEESRPRSTKLHTQPNTSLSFRLLAS